MVNHQRQVPCHLLKDVQDLSCGDAGSGNLIVQDDNLVALKALFPDCAGYLLGKDRLQAERILIRQTPYEIKVS